MWHEYTHKQRERRHRTIHPKLARFGFLWHSFVCLFVKCWFTFPRFNVDGDALGRSRVELHKNSGERGIDYEGYQEEEGEEAEGAKEDEERGCVEQKLLGECLIILFVRHLGERRQ